MRSIKVKKPNNVFFGKDSISLIEKDDSGIQIGDYEFRTACQSIPEDHHLLLYVQSEKSEFIQDRVFEPEETFQTKKINKQRFFLPEENDNLETINYSINFINKIEKVRTCILFGLSPRKMGRIGYKGYNKFPHKTFDLFQFDCPCCDFSDKLHLTGPIVECPKCKSEHSISLKSFQSSTK